MICSQPKTGATPERFEERSRRLAVGKHPRPARTGQSDVLQERTLGTVISGSENGRWSEEWATESWLRSAFACFRRGCRLAVLERLAVTIEARQVLA